MICGDNSCKLLKMYYHVNGILKKLYFKDEKIDKN